MGMNPLRDNDFVPSINLGMPTAYIWPIIARVDILTCHSGQVVSQFVQQKKVSQLNGGGRVVV